MVAKNNYYWGSENKELDFIANGDVAVVRRMRQVKKCMVSVSRMSF